MCLLKKLLFFPLLLVSGCTWFHVPVLKEPLPEEALIQIRIVEEIEYKEGYHALGLTRCSNNVCVIEIRRDQYPNCLVHEIRHVFEGDWHKGRETTEDCF